MIIWTGWGILTPFLVLSALIFTQKLVNAQMDDPLFYSQHAWPKLLACFLGGAFVFFVKKILDKFTKEREVIDAKTGEKLILKAKHTLFFIDMKFWAVVVPLIGVVLFLLRREVTPYV